MTQINEIQNGHYNKYFHRIYPVDELSMQQQRWLDLADSHRRRTGHTDMRLFSAPGRAELAGNHTDHNGGQVLATSVHLDTIAAVSPGDKLQITLISEGYEPVSVDLSNLSIREEEKGKTDALVRGVVACMERDGGNIGGFEATIASRVLKGSGLGSSATLEILVCCILNSLYNKGRFSALQMAQWSGEAENRYFGKSCGLMDQLACATGGVLAIDFLPPGPPSIESMEWSFGQEYILASADCRTDHADLTGEYALITQEMLQVAAELDQSVLGQVLPQQFREKIPLIRNKTGDRALLRAWHFFGENRRVDGMKKALLEGKIENFMLLMRESGLSSWRLLQNVIAPGSTKRQEMALALELAGSLLDGSEFACRVHGGGFGGTILALMPKAQFPMYRHGMEEVFKPKSVVPLHIRNASAGELCRVC